MRHTAFLLDGIVQFYSISTSASARTMLRSHRNSARFPNPQTSGIQVLYVPGTSFGVTRPAHCGWIAMFCGCGIKRAEVSMVLRHGRCLHASDATTGHRRFRLPVIQGADAARMETDGRHNALRCGRCAVSRPTACLPRVWPQARCGVAPCLLVRRLRWSSHGPSLRLSIFSRLAAPWDHCCNNGDATVS